LDEIITRIPDFKIRFAMEDDIPDVLKYIKDLARFENELQFVSATEEKLLDSLFNKKSAEVIFGEYKKNKIGFAVFHQTFSTFLGLPGINLVDLYIEPEHRNKGYGKELLSYLAFMTKERGCGRLEWWVHDWNEDAKRFYKRIGSTQVEQIRIYRLTGKELIEFGKRK
jgi:GNAT superfamily N-acetyltransferase